MGKGLVNFTNHSQFINYNHPNWYVLAKLPNNPDSKAVSYDIMVCTLGPSFISALQLAPLHTLYCDHHRYQFDIYFLIKHSK